ncbi:heparan sulfate glucosamine 3-O-sulfotransferase 1-like [Dysidea avara]|uniref:heparan sulfate glucosamine 3-O-sulfotransferase 1-like n=1 Tax=Dysidea avara TaxID=196820 RepID=UPI003326D2DD
MGVREIVLHGFVLLVALNAVRILLFKFTIAEYQQEYKQNCCQCSSPATDGHEIAIGMDTASLFNHNTTLIRIGNDLKFDYNSCPKSSTMLDPEKLNSVPLHNNCPRVFIIGARKAGTTSLYHYLSKHPDFEGILLDGEVSDGETFYFSANYGKPWENYVAHFPTDKMSGDGSVGNLVNCLVPERLYTSCGKAVKVIVLLRDPTARYQSNFITKVKHRAKHYTEFSKISTLILAEIDQLYVNLLHRKRNINSNAISDDPNSLACLFNPDANSIFEGLYYVHLHNWLCNFPAENMLILNTAEFCSNRNKVLSQVLSFVGLKPLDNDSLQQITKVMYDGNDNLDEELDFRILTAADKKKLKAVYRPFNDKLFRLLKWKNVSWNL